MASSDPAILPEDVLYLLNEWIPRKLSLPEAKSAVTNADVSMASVSQAGNKTDVRMRSPSKTTRPPGFYDKHLAPKFTLHRVKKLNRLIDDIARTVDKAAKDAHSKGIRLCSKGNGSLRHKDLVESDAADYDTVVRDENGVTEIYLRTTSQYCPPIASTLALHPLSPTWSTILNWSISSNENYAIADGFLKLSSRYHTHPAIPFIKPDILTCLDQLAARNKYDLAVWEMKSLSVGSGNVMEGVAKMAGKPFEWVYCKFGCGYCEPPQITYRVVDDLGPDAEDPPWKLPADGDETDVEDPKPERSRPLRATKRPISYLESSMEIVDGKPAKSFKRMEKVNKKMRESLEGELDSDADYLDFSVKVKKTKIGVKPRSFLQQVWAQGVRTNSTILILHSGNYEIIGIRVRKTGTLYLSELYEPHNCKNPGYGRIQTGIYIAAIQDALDRVKQRMQGDWKTSTNADGKNGDRVHKRNADDDEYEDSPSEKRHKSYGNAKGAQGLSRMDGNKSSGGHAIDANKASSTPSKNAYLEAMHRSIVFLHFCYGIYDSAVPATFKRYAKLEEPAMSPPRHYPMREFRHKNSMHITLTCELAHGASGIVHLGHMNVLPLAASASIPVAVKLAFNEDEKSMLKHEHIIYQHLRSKNVCGIPKEFGLFIDTELVDECEGPHALVMSHAGNSFFGRLESIPDATKSSLLDTLKDIHKAGVLHDDVRLLNLCSTASGEAFIIDFSHARFSTSESAMADELDDLCNILQMELPRSDPKVQPSTAGPKRIAHLNKAERARQKKGERPQSKKAKSPQPKKAQSEVQTSPQVAQRRTRRKGTA